MTLQQGLLYALLPSAAGAIVALALLLPAAKRADLTMEARQRLRVLLAMPATAVVLAFVAASLTQDLGDEARIPLLVLGAAGFVMGAGMGIVGSRRVAELDQPDRFGRIVLMLAAFEVPAILAFVWIMQIVPDTAA